MGLQIGKLYKVTESNNYTVGEWNPQGTIVECVKKIDGIVDAYEILLVDNCHKKMDEKCVGWVIFERYHKFVEIPLKEARKLKLKKLEKLNQ